MVVALPEAFVILRVVEELYQMAQELLGYLNLAVRIGEDVL
jgi:hypothetical protein